MVDKMLSRYKSDDMMKVEEYIDEKVQRLDGKEEAEKYFVESWGREGKKKGNQERWIYLYPGGQAPGSTTAQDHAVTQFLIEESKRRQAKTSE